MSDLKNGQRDHNAMEKRRLKAAKYFERGLGCSEVARRLGVRRQSAHGWMQAWQRGGRESLRSSGPAGRKPRMSDGQKRQLIDAMLAGPQQSGYATEVWTLPRVRALVRKHTGETYHTGHLSRMLRALGLSCQRPERRAIERDEKNIRRWKRVEWPAIKKKRAAKSASSSSSTRAD